MKSGIVSTLWLKQSALILASGPLPPQPVMGLLSRNAPYVVCADGGGNHARKLGITPGIILGDFDSINRQTIRWFRTVPQVLMKDQESTDLEKAIDHVISKSFKKVAIVGATGARVDHTIGNLGLFKKFGKSLEMSIFDQHGVLTLIRKGVRLKVKRGEKLSLIPLDRCEGVKTSGLLYPLHKEFLELGVREGTSNEATHNVVTIKVASGTLLLYRLYGLT